MLKGNDLESKNDIIPGKEYLDKMIEYRNIYGV